jgi:hypothetical protein
VIREGCKSSGASEARGSGAGDFRPRLADAGKGVNLTGGARLIERRGRDGRLGKA